MAALAQVRSDRSRAGHHEREARGKAAAGLAASPFWARHHRRGAYAWGGRSEAAAPERARSAMRLPGGRDRTGGVQSVAHATARRRGCGRSRRAPGTRVHARANTPRGRRKMGIGRAGRLQSVLRGLGARMRRRRVARRAEISHLRLQFDGQQRLVSVDLFRSAGASADLVGRFVALANQLDGSVGPATSSTGTPSVAFMLKTPASNRRAQLRLSRLRRERHAAEPRQTRPAPARTSTNGSRPARRPRVLESQVP